MEVVLLKSKPIIVQICRDATDTGGGRVALEISKYFALSGYKVIIIQYVMLIFMMYLFNIHQWGNS